MNNFFTRTITGFFFISIIIGSIIFLHEIFASVFLFIAIAGLWEFYNLLEKEKIYVSKFSGIITGLYVFICNALIATNDLEAKYLLIVFPLITLIFLTQLYGKSSKPFTNIGFTLLGIVYIIVPFSLLTYLPNINLIENTYNYEILLGFFILIWSNDTFAYITGILFGKHKLFERISPKKTWEGAIGGGLLTIGLSYLLSLYFTDLADVIWMSIATVIVIFGTLGDLVESQFKRSLNIKDSGNILPGHGGILDRFDGVIFAAPLVYVLLKLII